MSVLLRSAEGNVLRLGFPNEELVSDCFIDEMLWKKENPSQRGNIVGRLPSATANPLIYTEGLFITLMHPEDMEMNGFIGGMGGLSLANGHRGHAASNASLLAPRLSLLPQSACSSSLQALQAPEGNPEVPVAYQLSSGPCDEHKSYAFIQRYESTRSSVAPAVRQ
ncbi:hypothetical protein SNK03_004603 [Fusarium graminearum]